MGMLFSGKCPHCWERYENCTCSEGRGSDPVSRCNRCGLFLNYCACDKGKQVMSFMPSMFKCEKCGLPAVRCKCPDEIESKPLGKITPIKAYKTSDGRLFTGKGAQEDAEDHQRWLDYKQVILPDGPRKEPLKPRKRRKRGPRKDRH